MKTLALILTFPLGAFMILGGVNHFLTPQTYFPFIPDFLPQAIINYLAGAIEMVLGIGIFIPAFRHKASLGVLGLMVLFLPIHIIDVFRDYPVIGSHFLALIRVPIQFVFIGWAWFVGEKAKR